MRPSRGFTLIEVIAAVAIFAAVLGVFLSLSASGMRAARLSAQRLVASSIAQRGAEWARDRLRSYPDTVPSPGEFAEPQLSELRDARLDIQVTDHTPPREADLDASPVRLKKLDVTVSWLAGRRSERMSVSTLVCCRSTE